MTTQDPIVFTVSLKFGAAQQGELVDCPWEFDQHRLSSSLQRLGLDWSLQRSELKIGWGRFISTEAMRRGLGIQGIQRNTQAKVKKSPDGIFSRR
jgi:hypothetical protein